MNLAKILSRVAVVFYALGMVTAWVIHWITH